MATMIISRPMAERSATASGRVQAEALADDGVHAITIRVGEYGALNIALTEALELWRELTLIAEALTRERQDRRR